MGILQPLKRFWQEHEDELFIILGFILMILIGFALGYLACHFLIREKLQYQETLLFQIWLT